MFAYCLNSPTNYIDSSGKIIEEFSIKEEKTGFTVSVDARFLATDFCIAFAEELVEQRGSDGLYAGMTANRIAVELYAHAALYKYGESIPDISNTEANYVSQPDSNMNFGNGVVSFAKNYLIKHGREITVNNDESDFRMLIYGMLWKQATGKEWDKSKPKKNHSYLKQTGELQ